jgi:UV DNA damage endonuclease
MGKTDRSRGGVRPRVAGIGGFTYHIPMIRLGLCCTFRDQPIKFAHATAAAIGRMGRSDGLARLGRLGLANAEALLAAFRFCVDHGIGCFRINSQILPLRTHPGLGYTMDDLPDGDRIVGRFRECGAFAQHWGLRTGFHPDQFVVLNSPRPEVVEASVRELEYQAEVADWVGADVLNVHGGGGYGDKRKALDDLARNLQRLSPGVRSRLTVENDDKTFTPADLLPLCRSEGLPMVYDVHHHRCLADGLTVEQATGEALATWDREPLFHLSSPRDGWGAPRPERHHDYIDPRDFPDCWRALDLTVEVEAKAKEAAVLKLKEDLRGPASGSGRASSRPG